ncbi:ParB/RepB/Spo0J family partition protein, partial [Candidatus Uhrbacteria bacterium]|nr:ParB/RepB/Spo0J family partition protein [Candidatus Uhrbacteria bacterium]
MVLRPDPPVRDHFDEQELSRLTASIREHGILVPLMVRRRGDQFEVVDGDRRLAAAWQAGCREVPVMVYDLDDRQTHIQRMLANLDRHDPDPVSEAKYIAKVIHAGTFDIETFAAKLGRSLDWVEGRLTIAEMPPYMQAALAE